VIIRTGSGAAVPDGGSSDASAAPAPADSTVGAFVDCVTALTGVDGAMP
jgi:hypothetical protein